MTGTDLMTKCVQAIDDDETILNVMYNLLWIARLRGRYRDSVG
jgi:hypothetical protein